MTARALLALLRPLNLLALWAAPVLAFCAMRPPQDPRAARSTSRALKGALLAGIAGLWLGAKTV